MSDDKSEDLIMSIGRPICVLTSNHTSTESHYEEAGSANEEMQLHLEKMEASNVEDI